MRDSARILAGVISLVRVIYKVTYPNDKIYISKDLTNRINYFGSASSQYIERDFTPEERRQFSVVKGILWESETASDEEINRRELEYIRSYESNNPSIGYNRWPTFRSR